MGNLVVLLVPSYDIQGLLFDVVAPTAKPGTLVGVKEVCSLSLMHFPA